MGELDYAPPVDDIPESQFGGYCPDGIQSVKIENTRVQDNGVNAWIDCRITDGQYADQGVFGMNLYLPTKEELNRKNKEKGDKKAALASFFHYKETCKVCGIPAGATIARALELMVGWEGKALMENRPGFNTNIKKLLPSGSTAVPEAPPLTGDAEVKDTPF